MTETQKFAFVDVETTGSSLAMARITDIAVVVIEGNKVTKTFNSLVNPHRDIPANITRFTGISNKMVADAPDFSELIPELEACFENAVFVAHNARFDYGFVKQAFMHADKPFSAKTLCTVKLSRLMEPEFRRHGLDALIERHNLVFKNRHRALDDCLMLIQMWHLWQQTPERFEANVKQLLQGPVLPTHINKAQIEPLPHQPGVYQFFTEDTKIPIYIGKSKDLRKRVLSHFSADYKSAKQARMVKQIQNIDFTPTAGELGALLLESQLIKAQMPIFNRQLRRQKTLFGLRVIKETEYHQIQVHELEPEDFLQTEDTYGCFRNPRAAKTFLEELVIEEGLCQKFLGLEKTQGACFAHDLGRCQGACVQKVEAPLYNLKLLQSLQKLKLAQWPFKGPIGIIEKHPETGTQDIHYFDQWCYLESEYEKTETPLPELNLRTKSFDLDTYKILKKFIYNQDKYPLEIIDLPR